MTLITTVMLADAPEPSVAVTYDRVHALRLVVQFGLLNRDLTAYVYRRQRYGRS